MHYVDIFGGASQQPVAHESADHVSRYAHFLSGLPDQFEYVSFGWIDDKQGSYVCFFVQFTV